MVQAEMDGCKVSQIHRFTNFSQNFWLSRVKYAMKLSIPDLIKISTNSTK